MKNIFVTITGQNHYLGMKPYKIGRIVKLVKDKDNEYDEDAIAVVLPFIDVIGYVANSTNTVNNQKMHAYFQASQQLLDSYLDWDLRLTHYIVQAPNGNGGMMNMAFGKVNIGTTYYLPTAQARTFGRCLRLSEAYLNYAEAMAMMGGKGDNEAAAAINALREKRFFEEDFEEETFSSNAELVQFIREERRRELCFEGHRWFDLRRWGMPAITHKWHISDSESDTYILKQGDLLYTVPIPDEAISMNNSLEQNELPSSNRVPQ